MRITTKQNLWMAGCLLLGTLVFVATANASGDRITQNTHVNSQGGAGGLGGDASTTVQGDRSDALGIGLSNSLGDVAIRDCVASTQWNTPLFGKQGIVLNPWCAAEAYDSRGMHDMAARMRCKVPAIAEEFTEEKEFDRMACIAANTYQPVKSVPRETSKVPHLEAQLAEYRAENDALRDDLSAQIEILSVALKKAQRRPTPAPAKPQTIIQQESFLNDKKRAELASLVSK